jgi:hypothetical protein
MSLYREIVGHLVNDGVPLQGNTSSVVKVIARVLDAKIKRIMEDIEGIKYPERIMVPAELSDDLSAQDFGEGAEEEILDAKVVVDDSTPEISTGFMKRFNVKMREALKENNVPFECILSKFGKGIRITTSRGVSIVGKEFEVVLSELMYEVSKVFNRMGKPSFYEIIREHHFDAAFRSNDRLVAVSTPLPIKLVNKKPDKIKYRIKVSGVVCAKCHNAVWADKDGRIMCFTCAKSNAENKTLNELIKCGPRCETCEVGFVYPDGNGNDVCANKECPAREELSSPSILKCSACGHDMHYLDDIEICGNGKCPGYQKETEEKDNCFVFETQHGQSVTVQHDVENETVIFKNIPGEFTITTDLFQELVKKLNIKRKRPRHMTEKQIGEFNSKVRRKLDKMELPIIVIVKPTIEANEINVRIKRYLKPINGVLEVVHKTSVAIEATLQEMLLSELFDPIKEQVIDPILQSGRLKSETVIVKL